MKPKITLLSKEHDRGSFDCGVEALNVYLQKQAGQDMRNHYASVFVSLEEETGRTSGYYTLSNASIRLDALTGATAKRLPRYPDVPAIRLGRLAVDRAWQGRGLGTALLADAVVRCVANVSAWTALVVDAKDEDAVAFYRRFGFTRLSEGDKQLFIMRKPLVDYIASPPHRACSSFRRRPESIASDSERSLESAKRDTRPAATVTAPRGRLTPSREHPSVQIGNKVSGQSLTECYRRFFHTLLSFLAEGRESMPATQASLTGCPLRGQRFSALRAKSDKMEGLCEQ